MRKFTESENIAISGILKIEGLSLAFARVLKPIIDDIDLKKLLETGILEHEGRINALKKIIEDCGKGGVES
ncbi:MAG TPA: hypothetical protein GX692_08470 [Acholeplasmataceae bacterium]|jgi:hypothetical protein|nr:hypothetical protein [Acholeplasmataceae bacterium]